MAVLALLRNDKKKALNQIKHLIKTNKDVAHTILTTDVDGWTPIHACAMKGSKKLLKAMLQAGMSINCVMGQPDGLPAGCTLLHVAANRPDKKILDYLLHHGADVHARDSFGRTPLYYAKLSENKDAVKLLMDCGARLDDADGSQRQTKQQQRQQHRLTVSASETPQLRHRSHRYQQNSLRPRSGHETMYQRRSCEDPTAVSSRQHSQQAYDGNYHSTARKYHHIPQHQRLKDDATASNSHGVPSVKAFSSTPCLLVPGGASGRGSDIPLTSSSSSSNRLPRKHGSSVNNNNLTGVTNRNSRESQDRGSQSDSMTLETKSSRHGSRASKKS